MSAPAEYWEDPESVFPIYLQDCDCDHPLEEHGGADPGNIDVRSGCTADDCHCRGIVIDEA